MLSKGTVGEVVAAQPTSSRIRIGPIPEWVIPVPFDPQFKAANEVPVTQLLIDRQLHAERRERYNHVAIRLETLEAVQRESQWRLEFEPQTQSVTLHSVKIRRGTSEIEHANIEKGHLLQREESLSRFVIDGWFSFLLVLEDVRVGDILEWAYTVKDSPKILPQFCSFFFVLPSWISVGKYHFSARADASRALKWKASSPELKPVETTENGEVVWNWAAEKYIGLKPEPNTPSWFISAPWIQVSDCPDWPTVAAGISEAWGAQESGTKLDELLKEIEAHDLGIESRIDRAIQLIQDDHRYFSVNLEFGGQIPAPPDTVARRRYGDCKDLSFLLVNLLRKIGVTARPVLVHTGLKNNVAEMLPTAALFNHVIVEFELEEKRRWVDATMKRQGGGALNRHVHDFGVGLPVDPTATGLIDPPKIPSQSNLYELHETILLDTTGSPSLLSTVLRAEGSQADSLRNQVEAIGQENLAEQHLQACANRFGRAKRIGSLKHRDDRAANQFFLAQVFEIDGFLAGNSTPGFCHFQIPSHWITQTLMKPEKERRTPFAIPYPCQVVHIIDVESPTLRQMSSREVVPRFSLPTPHVQFAREKKTGYGYWLLQLKLDTISDSVPPDKIQKHKEFVDQVWKESLWYLKLPVGYAKPHQKRGFGELPPAKIRIEPVPMTSAPVSAPVLSEVSRSPSPLEKSETPRPMQNQIVGKTPRRRRRRQPQVGNNRAQKIAFCIIAFVALLVFLLIWAVAEGKR